MSDDQIDSFGALPRELQGMPAGGTWSGQGREQVVVGGPKGGRRRDAIERVKATPGAVLACATEAAADDARERHGLTAEQVTWPREKLGLNPGDVFDWYGGDPWIG